MKKLRDILKRKKNCPPKDSMDYDIDAINDSKARRKAGLPHKDSMDYDIEQIRKRRLVPPNHGMSGIKEVFDWKKWLKNKLTSSSPVGKDNLISYPKKRGAKKRVNPVTYDDSPITPGSVVSSVKGKGRHGSLSNAGIDFPKPPKKRKKK